MPIVYALITKSNPNEMRYIGRTEFETPDKRLKEHLSEAAHSEQSTYKLNWIRKVLADTDEVFSIVVELDLSWKESGTREIFLIAHYKELGHRLTNATLGGDGMLGWIPTEETKAKIGAANTGRRHTEEAKAKQRTASMGNKSALGYRHSDASKANMGLNRAGRKLSDKAKANMSVAHMGYVTSEETKAKQRAANIGISRPWSPARRAAEIQRKIVQ